MWLTMAYSGIAQGSTTVRNNPVRPYIRPTHALSREEGDPPSSRPFSSPGGAETIILQPAGILRIRKEGAKGGWMQ